MRLSSKQLLHFEKRMMKLLKRELLAYREWRRLGIYPALNPDRLPR